MPQSDSRPRRSVLYVPAKNERALRKVAELACDAVILDLEDSVHPDDKAEARANAAAFLSDARPRGKQVVVRINAVDGLWGRDDLAAIGDGAPEAVLLPKVNRASDIVAASAALDAYAGLARTTLWIMAETPGFMMDLSSIAALPAHDCPRLSCVVAGTNDLAKDTGIAASPDRRYLAPLLLQMVLAARAGGMVVLDGVSNNFRDAGAFERECQEAKSLGFDGKTLIHPAQIGPANSVFAPDTEELEAARAVIAAFNEPENRTKGVIVLEGRMVERLHLQQAQRLVAKANAIARTH